MIKKVNKRYKALACDISIQDIHKQMVICLSWDARGVTGAIFIEGIQIQLLTFVIKVNEYCTEHSPNCLCERLISTMLRELLWLSLRSFYNPVMVKKILIKADCLEQI